MDFENFQDEFYELFDEMGDYFDEGEALSYFNENLYQNNELSFASFTETCLLPTIRDVASYYFPTLSLCVVFQLIVSCLRKREERHIISGVLGLAVLYFHFGVLSFQIIFLVSLFCISVPVILKYEIHTIVTSTFLLCYLTICEFTSEASSWSRIRNVDMLIVMKIISLLYDFEMKRIPKFPTFLEFFGYIFCVGNCVFGPWIDFTSYLDIYVPKKLNLEYVIDLLKSIFLSFLFFSISMCYVDWFFQSTEELGYFLIYGTALEFRAGHYFVMFMSSAFSLAAGIRPKSPDVAVTQPSKIEFLHSLGEVVIYWNIPMHKWLKSYIFSPLQMYGNFIAIIGTYFVSSLLHGLNFQLSGVLLSLGIYTYVEYVFRRKLASRFNACIASKACPTNCSKHRYTRRLLIVHFINLLLSVVALYHLSYLGFLIDIRMEKNLSFSFAFRKWRALNFESHVIVLGTYIIQFLL